MSIPQAELWGILLGMCIAWSRGFRIFEVETDSKLDVNLLHNGCARSHPCYVMLQNIMMMVNLGGSFPWLHLHILREVNQVTDALAGYC